MYHPFVSGNIIIGLAIGLLFNLLSLVCPYSTEHRGGALLVNMSLGLFFACVAYLHSPGTEVASLEMPTVNSIRKSVRRILSLEERSAGVVVNYRKIMEAGLKADERGV